MTSLATVDDLGWSLTARDVQVEIRTAPASAAQLLSGQQPRWPADVAQKLASLRALPDNWDSYGAPRVSISTVVSALQLLERLGAAGAPAPDIVPLSSGGVQLEWAIGNLELELSLEPDGRMVVLFDDTWSGESWERELAPRDLTPIRDALRRIAHAGRSR